MMSWNGKYRCQHGFVTFGAVAFDRSAECNDEFERWMETSSQLIDDGKSLLCVMRDVSKVTHHQEELLFRSLNMC